MKLHRIVILLPLIVVIAVGPGSAQTRPDGKAQPTAMLFDRLVHHHHLTNLVWVKAPEAAFFANETGMGVVCARFPSHWAGKYGGRFDRSELAGSCGYVYRSARCFSLTRSH
jgi:hypothetical protein